MSTGQRPARNSLLARFGRGITILRTRRQLTRKGLANRLKVSYAQLGFWERGVCGPPLPKLFALTRILDTSLDELIEVGGVSRELPVISKEEDGRTGRSSTETSAAPSPP